MSATGDTFPGAGSTSGSPAWSDPGDITADDSSFATVTGLLAGNTTGNLIATDFGFGDPGGVPNGATIDGVEVKIGKYATRIDMHDYVVRLWTGSEVGDDKADGVTDWDTGGIVEASYGGAADDWNASLSASDVRASSFGATIRAINDHASLPSSPSVDYFKINVTYTEQPTEPSFQFFVLLVLIALTLQLNIAIGSVLLALALYSIRPKRRTVTRYVFFGEE